MFLSQSLGACHGWVKEYTGGFDYWQREGEDCFVNRVVCKWLFINEICMDELELDWLNFWLYPLNVFYLWSRQINLTQQSGTRGMGGRTILPSTVRPSVNHLVDKETYLITHGLGLILYFGVNCDKEFIKNVLGTEVGMGVSGFQTFIWNQYLFYPSPPY